MTALIPLFLLWAINNRSNQGTLTRSAAPAWPTPKSPPPPLPAFDARPTAPSADPSHTSTPLAELHNAPPKLAPAHLQTPQSVKQAAISAFKKKAAQQLKARVSPTSLTSFLTSSPSTTASVASIQKILAGRGLRVVQDGLYGPKTASAWKKLASSKQLPSAITRVGPQTAKVVARTYESLSTPAIP